MHSGLSEINIFSFVFKGKAKEYYRELESTKHELDIANKEMDGYRKRLTEQCEAVKEIEVKSVHYKV